MNVNKQNLNTTYDDIPELDDDFFQRAELKDGDTLIRAGRPKLDHPKEKVTIRFDAEVVNYFKSTGKGWQTRMNDALNQWMKEHAKA